MALYVTVDTPQLFFDNLTSFLVNGLGFTVNPYDVCVVGTFMNRDSLPYLSICKILNYHIKIPRWYHQSSIRLIKGWHNNDTVNKPQENTRISEHDIWIYQYGRSDDHNV